MNSINAIPLNKKLPQYGYPISRSVISLDDKKLMTTLVLKGMPFESESSSQLESAFSKVKGFFNQLAKIHGSNLAIWTHIVKRKDVLDESYSFDNSFVQSFADKYVNSFSGERFFKTHYFVTFVLKYNDTLEHATADFDELLKITLSVLKSFDCSLLAINDSGNRCENIEFLSYLLNNTEKPLPLTSSKAVDVIGQSDWHFGYDLLEIRNADSDKSTYATFYELDGFPLATERGMWDFVLSQKCEFILTQSMILMKPIKAMDVLDKQINLVSSGDNAEHELSEIERAKDYVATGEISFGDYHCSLAVFSDSEKGAISDGNDLSSEFLARGTILKRSNLKSQFSFLSLSKVLVLHTFLLLISYILLHLI